MLVPLVPQTGDTYFATAPSHQESFSQSSPRFFGGYGSSEAVFAGRVLALGPTLAAWGAGTHVQGGPISAWLSRARGLHFTVFTSLASQRFSFFLFNLAVDLNQFFTLCC